MISSTYRHSMRRSSGPAIADVIGGQIPITFEVFITALSYVKAGRLRALAQTGSARSIHLPDVPTIAETGVCGYESIGWYGLLAPAGTPQAIVGRLHSEMSQIMATADRQKRMVDLGADPANETPEQFGAFIRAEIVKWAKVDIVHIPYKSAAPALTDVIAGQNHLMFATALSVLPHIKAEKLRPLGVTTAKRVRALPEIPTIAEAGVPGFEASTWHGVLVPAGTPAPIVAKLNSEINRALQIPDVRERLHALGAEIVGSTPQEFAEHIKVEIPKWAQVIKTAGVQIE